MDSLTYGSGFLFSPSICFIRFQWSPGVKEAKPRPSLFWLSQFLLALCNVAKKDEGRSVVGVSVWQKTGKL